MDAPLRRSDGFRQYDGIRGAQDPIVVVHYYGPPVELDESPVRDDSIEALPADMQVWLGHLGRCLKLDQMRVELH